jgi:hypothetical protein
MKIPTLRELVSPENQVLFTRYFNRQLWYRAVGPNSSQPWEFEFPIPITEADAGNATFWPADKALLFMRWIRPHRDALEQAQSEQQSDD